MLPDISFGDRFSINLGGAVIPFILAVYLFIKSGNRKRKRQGGIGFAGGWSCNLSGRKAAAHEPETIMIDPNYVYGIMAGIIAYLFGRSRRSSFIAGIMGVILADIAQGIENIIRGIPAPVRLGSAGAVDTVVISGFLAVLLAEVVGELRERLQGGTEKKHMRFDHAEFTSAIGAEDVSEEKVSEESEPVENWCEVDEEGDVLEDDDYPVKEGDQ